MPATASAVNGDSVCWHRRHGECWGLCHHRQRQRQRSEQYYSDGVDHSEQHYVPAPPPKSSDAAKTYGQTAALSGYSVSGLVNGDSVDAD
ncbi:hypothetical protein [Sporomusa ovata]|uniref:hypothetical protein n=1 Tax=Sporomusa ovata TaxID=2378 RepID=UPI0030CA985A